MSFQPGSNNYPIAFGTSPENVEVPHIDSRVPQTTDVNYPIGKRWIDLNVGEYTLLGQTSIGGVLSATWSLLGTTGGALNTLTGDSGGAISPSVGNITLSGTGSQITTTGSGSTITLSIPATFLAPGSIASTTTLTAGTSLAVTTSATIGTGLTITSGGLIISAGGAAITGTTSINTTGAATTNIGTGPGTGIVNIGNATGNTTIPAGNLTATSGNIVASSGNISATLGSLNAGTTLTAGTGITATTGNITASSGNMVINGAGHFLAIHHGAATDFNGTATLTAGTVTIANTNIAAGDQIYITRNAVNASTTLGEFTYTITAATSFTVTSVIIGTPGSTQTGDLSSFGYFIVRPV